MDRQTCTAPDYTLLPSFLQDDYVSACTALLTEWFPTGELQSSSFGKIPRGDMIDRLERLLDQTKGIVVRRGTVDRERGKMGISIVKDVGVGDVLMQEEIFGPILVVCPVDVSRLVRFLFLKQTFDVHPFSSF